MHRKKRIHPAARRLKAQFDQGKISRREFIRYSSLLGLTAVSASQAIGIPSPFTAGAAAVARGGVLKISSQYTKITHPALLANITASNILRQVSEYLTYTDENNITHPYLLESWVPSDDLKAWTLNVRQGVKFNNGDELTADDVVFTFEQWLNKDVGSSMQGLIGGYLKSGNIEKVSGHQVKLHLDRPEMGVPEHLFHYPALVLNHRTFNGNFLQNPHGTGAFTLEKHNDVICVLKRRNDYWRTGQDGQSLPYLDGVEFHFVGNEMAPKIAGLLSGNSDIIDTADTGAIEVFNSTKGSSKVRILPASTCQTRILRMRSDVKPWSDNRVRTALKLCQHREKILSLAFFGEGLQGQDVHVSPTHPEYCKIETPKYDPERAKALLAEAGYPDGLKVELVTNASLPEIVRYAEILHQDARKGGFDIKIVTVPSSTYWEKWTEYPLGITTWGHRPLGTMVLNLAYSGDENGNPAPWNETKWVDPEFQKLLKQANGTFDVEKRRKIFCRLEAIQQERGSIGNAFWMNTWLVTGKSVQGVKAHPSNYLKLEDAWLGA